MRLNSDENVPGNRKPVAGREIAVLGAESHLAPFLNSVEKVEMTNNVQVCNSVTETTATAPVSQ